MFDLNIRVTQRHQIDGRAVERSIDINSIKPLGELSEHIQSTVETNVTACGDGLIDNTDDRYRRIYDRATKHNRSEAHVAVLDTFTDLMWSVQSLGDPAGEDDGITREHCIERCKQLRLLGFDDWRLPTRAQLAALVDDTRHDPAINTDLFPGVKPRWHWTSTPAAWSSASAWFVGFDGGVVSSYPRYYLGFALAVRRASQ